MSREIATAFIEKTRTDGAFQQKLLDLGPDASVNEVLEVAESLGFVFTEKDLFEAAKADTEVRMANGQELNEIELENVTGGNLTNFGAKKILTFANSLLCKSYGCKVE